MSFSGFPVGLEADLRARGLGRLKEAAEGGEDLFQVGVVRHNTAFEGGELLAELGVGAGEVAQVDEGTDDEDAHFHGTGAVQNRCCPPPITAPCSVKAQGRYRRPPRPGFEVTICDLKRTNSSSES